MPIQIQTAQHIADTGEKITIGGGVASAWGFLTSNGFVGAVGALVAIGGLFVTWYYKREANRRLAAEHKARMLEFELRRLRLLKGMPDVDLDHMGADD